MVAIGVPALVKMRRFPTPAAIASLNVSTRLALGRNVVELSAGVVLLRVGARMSAAISSLNDFLVSLN
jgi:hypothetical protein